MCKNLKSIAILGSTGSIGTQALEIISKLKNYKAHLLSANKNFKLLCEQALLFKPKNVVINDETGYYFLKEKLKNQNINVWLGEKDLCGLLSDPEIDLVLTSIVGSAGLKPTISAIRAKKNIALANKETLVVAGGLIMSLAKKMGVKIIPVDSEHSAIFQCLVGESIESVSKLILTASGGPFLNLDKKLFKNITVEKALKHPNWSMGSKITIDSATLMNKGLELIEAHWLFDKPIKDISVVVHPESIIHSLVEFSDGSLKAQLGLPTMITPILYAFSYPKRTYYKKDAFSLADLKSLTFFEPNTSKFPHLNLAKESIKIGGNAPCVLNAANEVAVEAFLNKRINFLDMIKIVEKSLENFNFVENPALEDYYKTDKSTRMQANYLIKKL